MLEPMGSPYHGTHQWDRIQSAKILLAAKSRSSGICTNSTIYSSGLKPVFSYQKHSVSMRYLEDPRSWDTHVTGKGI